MYSTLVLADSTKEGMILLAVIVSAIALLLVFALTAVIRWVRSRR